MAPLVPIIDSFGFDAPTIPEVRARFHAAAAAIPAPEGVAVEVGELGGLVATRIRPTGVTPAGRIVHLHGGAFCVGSVEVQLGVPAAIALATGHEVLAPEYRLAPEHPCPAAVEDAVAAWTAALDEGPTPAALTGDSAGATLAVLAAASLRDAGATMPPALGLLSPWVDLAGRSDRWHDEAFEDPVLPRALLRRAAEAWLGGRSTDDPAATPLGADLTGLPPTLVHVGGDELLLDDALALGARLARAGVDVDVHVWPGMIHVFCAYPTLVPEADRALAQLAGLVARVRHDRSEGSRG